MGSWAEGFELRAIDDDPWQLDIFNPEQVRFAAPEEVKDRVVELREGALEVVRPMLITDEPYQKLRRLFRSVFTNQVVAEYAEEHGANIFAYTTHSMFADLGITAGAAFEAMSELPPDHPFGTNGDPRDKQDIISGRVLSLLKHEDLGAITGGLPLVEGLMMPFAGVTLTYSSRGSSLHLREHLGRHKVRGSNDLTTQSIEGQATRGNHLFHVALHGSQVKWERRGFLTKRVIGTVSRGTADLVVGLNQGHEATRKNILVGIGFDCPSFKPDGSYEPQNAGVELVPNIMVPTDARDVDIAMGVLADYSSLASQAGLPSFVSDSLPEPSKRDLDRLEEITLTKIAA